MKTISKVYSWILLVALFLLVLLYFFVYRSMVINDAFFLPDNIISNFQRAYPEQEKLKQHVNFLTSITPARNVNQVESLNKAAKYIQSQFENLGLTVQSQVYKVKDREYKNLIVELPANAEKNSSDLIIVGAHYDVCGDQPGADDNASGVAGLIELARLLVSPNAPKRKYPLQLVAFALEEPPTYNTEDMGSFVHANSLFRQHKRVKVMISLEMIGFFSDEPNSQSFPIDLLKLDYPTTGNFITLVSNLESREMVRKVRSAMKSATEIEVFSINAPKLVPGIDFSDHRSYWKFDYKDSMMLTDTSFYRNSNYHKPSDTINTLNFAKMSQVIAGVYGVVSLLD